MKWLSQFFRCYSTKKIKIIQVGSANKNKGEKVKSLNIENHLLYGAVTKTKEYKKSSIESLEKTKSSEVYWLTLNEAKEFPKKKSSKVKPNDAKLFNGLITNAQDEKLKVKKQRKTEFDDGAFEEKPLEKLRTFQKSLPFIPTINLSHDTFDVSKNLQDIPFSAQQLKGMINFPITPSSALKWNKRDKINISPSVSKILNATMSDNARRALLKWKTLKIAELGQEGFDLLQKSYLERGKNFHSSLEYHLSGRPIEESLIEKVPELWSSVKKALDRVGVPARLIETKVYHPYLLYNGVVDCMSTIDSKLHVIEWKTSDSTKHSLDSVYDAPLQLCAYLGALNASPDFMTNPICKGVIIVAYTSGDPASLHFMDEMIVRKYWNAWLCRLQEYWIRYRDKTLPEPI